MTLPYRALYLLALTSAAAQLRADVTVRYEFSEQSHLPRGFAYTDPFKNGHEMTIRVKGDRGLLSMGHFTSIVDLARKEVTVLNAITKTFTTLPMESLLKDGPGNPLDPRATGRTDTIGGVPAEEKRSERGGFTWEFWVPKDGEAGRFPVLAELMRFQGPYLNKSANAGMAFMIDQELGPDSISAMLAELLQTPFLLRFRSAGYGLEQKQELVELSAAPIDDAAFLPPQNYREVPFTEVLKMSPTPAPPESGVRPGSLKFTLIDGVITYGGGDGGRKRIDVGKRCRDLWVAPDESMIAFIRVDKSEGYENNGEPFVRASTVFVARRSENFVPVQVPIPTDKVLIEWGVFVNPSISADGSTVFFMVWEGNYSFFFAYNLNASENQQVGGGIDYCTIWSGPDKGSILMYQRNWIGDEAKGPLDPAYKYECFIATPGSRDIPGSCAEFEKSFRRGAACTLPPR